MERSTDLIAALLAVLKAGGAYLPVETESPAPRVAAMLAAAGTRLVLVTAGTAAAIPPLAGVEVVRVDAEPGPETDQSSAPPDVSHSLSLAYVSFTSGSTGVPKGVAIPQRAVVRLVSDPTFVTLGPGERLLQLAPVAFDASTLEIWGALLTGATLVIAPPGPLGLSGIASLLRTGGVTIAWLTAGLFHELADSEIDALASVRVLLSGGEVLNPDKVRAVLAARRGRQLVNGYGPTENTTFISCHVMSDPGQVGPTVPIGRPIQHTSVHILDDSGRQVPIGVVGELYAGGDGLARGYSQNPAATARAFVPDPAGHGARLYRTGDLARWRADGSLDFIGRRDEQVKIRGFRVEPGEVEAVLRTHPGVRDAFVLAAGEGAQRHLVGYVTPAEGADPGDLRPSRLHDFAAARLPEYLVPAGFKAIGRLPLNANGKVDRRALPEPDLEQRGPAARPRGAIEGRLAELWRSLLRADGSDPGVGREDSFFAIGGNSLLAARLTFRIHEVFGVELSMASFYEEPTLAATAAAIDAAASAAAVSGQASEVTAGASRRAATPSGIVRRDRSGYRVAAGRTVKDRTVAGPTAGKLTAAVCEFPASFSQRRMWLLDQLYPGVPAYNIAWALRLDGQLDVDALRQAWDAALARHEALRTTFREESGVLVQLVDDELAARPLLVSSVEHLDAGLREAAVRAQIADRARACLDISAEPLARPILIRLSPEAHVLVVVMHHILADGWSFRILFDELSADYEAISRNGGPYVQPPPIQYADFAIWQIEHAASGGYASAEEFWPATLSGAPPLLPLPADEPYPAQLTFAADGIDIAIDMQLAEALRQLAARHGTTLFAVLLAAYAVVLGRLTGSDDLLIAVPMAARTRPETESVVGLFMNTVTVRIPIDADGTLADLVRSVHAATTRALAHQELPFTRVVELVAPDRQPGRMPLEQVMFAMEESWAIPDRAGLRWRPELIHTGTTKFEIELTVTDAPAGPQVRVNYNSAVFHRATGELVADGFATMLRSLAEDPDRIVADADIMSQADLDLVTRMWPDGGQVADPEATVLARLWAACSGDTVVASNADSALTGADVRSLAWQVTAALRGHGVGVSDRVAILLPRSPALLPAIAGSWAAGASYVPMDPIYPAQRLAAMLTDAGASAIVIDSSVPGAPDPPPGAGAIPVIDLAALDGGGTAPAVLPDLVLDLPPSATAVTIFTSGSTGRPKAVSVTHGGIAALLSAVAPKLRLGPADRFVAVSTFAFDIALVELLAPVLAGGQVVIASADEALDAARLLDLLASSGATALQATPAGWRMLVDTGGIPAGVRLRMTAGEPLPRDLADAIGAGEGVLLWNLYGPTETTIYSGGDAVAPSPAPIEIGSVIAGTRLYVLDARLRLVPPGVTGEVYISGDGVANGYHGAPGMTAGRFVPDPFSERPGARMYRTGDVGRWRRSGRIELAGRADRQIKIRGYRIECGEVEAALRNHEDIAQAVVSVRGAGYDARLVGYLVTRSGAARPPAGLRQRLREKLPDYMVPAAFVVLPALPLTSNGKVDYRALPEPDWGTADSQALSAPRTAAESRLTEIMAEVLGLPAPARVSDSFFALGGHSLTATRLMARIRDAFDVDLPIRALFADPTVAGLAAALAAADGDAAAPAVGDGAAESAPATRFPASYGQRRLWSIDQLRPGEPTYNMAYQTWLDGPLDVEALQRAVDVLVSRHAALRTSIVARDLVPEQVVADVSAVQIERIGLPGTAGDADRTWQAETIGAERARQPFDLAAGPMIRVTLIGTEPGRHLLVLVIHHAVSDGASVKILFDELSAAYRAEVTGVSAALPPLWMHYGDYAVWQHEQMRSDELDRQLGYWRERLGGAPQVLTLPADRPRPAQPSARGAMVTVNVDAATTRLLAIVARDSNATMSMAFLAGFAAVLSRYARQPDLLIATQVAGRTHAELEPIVGYFTNTLPLRVSLADDPIFAGLLGRVRDVTVDALTHQTPFEILMEDQAPDAALASSRLVQVAFVYGSRTPPALDFPGITARSEALLTGTAKFELTLYADAENSGATTLTLEYSTDLFGRAWADRFLGSVACLLEHAAAAPGSLVADLPMLSGGPGSSPGGRQPA
jgi:amino acid adenylation domain-containing protein